MTDNQPGEWITRPIKGVFDDEVETVRAIEHSKHGAVRVDGWEDQDGNCEYGVSLYEPRQGMSVSEARALAKSLRSAATELDAVIRDAANPVAPPVNVPPIDPDPANFPRPRTLATEEELKDWEFALKLNAFDGQFFHADIRCAPGRSGFIYRVEVYGGNDIAPLWISPNFTDAEDAIEWAEEAIQKFWHTLMVE